MTYEVYKQRISKEKYFANWDSEKFGKLTTEIRDNIYTKYLLKCEVFSRDKFICRNIGCNRTDRLTLHHIKWQKNGGKDSPRNTVTICDSCHKAYHRGKRELTFPNDKILPDHIRGHTFKVSEFDEVNWKELKKKMKEFRKTLKGNCYYVSDEQWTILMTLFFC